MSLKQDKKVLVSIIIPFYNVENYIEKTLDSIEQQIFKNFDVILIDDGSTDNSYYLVKSYIMSCNFQSTLIRQNNSGVSSARNTGLKYASGDYIVFVDADDLLSPYYLKWMYEHLKTNNMLLAICDYQRFYDDKPIHDNRQIEEYYEIMDSLELMHEFLFGTIKISIWSIMVKRNLIEKYNIRFADGYKYSEDIHFVWRILVHTDKVIIEHTHLYYYRWRKGSAMAKFSDSRIDGLYLMMDLEKYFVLYCSDFKDIFLKYGVARWVWATLWQAACALPYFKFKDVSIKLEASNILKNLYEFPDLRVRLSSKLFNYSSYIYYIVTRITAKMKGADRFN